MMQLFSVVLSLLLILPQGIGGKAGVGGKAGFGGGATAGAAAPTPVQACNGNNFSTSATCVFGGNVTISNHIYVMVLNGDAANPVNSMTGCGITWSIQTFTPASNLYHYDDENVPGTAACTISISKPGGNTTLEIAAVEVSGGNGFDNTWNWKDDGFQATTCATNSITTTANNDLLLAGSGVNGNGTFGATAPFALVTNASSNNPSFGIASYAQPTAAAISTSMTQTTGTQCSAFILSIKHP